MFVWVKRGGGVEFELLLREVVNKRSIAGKLDVKFHSFLAINVGSLGINHVE